MVPDARMIPEWKNFLSQLKKSIQEKEQENQEAQSQKYYCCKDDKQTEEEITLYLDAAPSIQFHSSCAPNYLHCLTAFSGHSGNVVVGFKWGHTMLRHRMEMWADNGEGQLRHYLSIPMDNSYRVDHLVFVPCQRVLVGACSDLSLRVFSDTTEEMTVLYRASCPASVACMHFCPETNELLTGSMGLIAFWGFWTSPQSPLGLIRVLDWHCCSLQRDTLVGALVTERQTSSIYALCHRSIKSFEHTGKRELLQFQGHSQATLRCIATDWVQRYMYTGDAAGYVQVWSRDIGGLLYEFRAHAQPVTSVLLRSDTCSLLTSSVSGWIKEWSRSGDLLLKLYVDAPGGVRHMWLLGENCILCHSPSSLAVWRLNSLYRLFNDTGCGLRLLRRVECGRGKAQLLAVTQDGIARFLSPASGELLLLSWPFLHLDKAQSFAYSPSQEELIVSYGGPEVLVLNTALSPCPAKHVICTTKDHDDGVMCVEAVLLDGMEWAGTDTLICLVFSGHRNGKLQLLSPCELYCQPQQAHIGAILQTSSLPGQTPMLCCYGTDDHFSIWLVRVEGGQVGLLLKARVSCPFTPVISRLLPGLICAISPRQNLLFFPLLGGECMERERNFTETISCMDYCPPLGLVALSGPGGNVEIWDCHGNILTEIRLGMPVSQVCFANARGDILACFGGSICLISSIHFLPVRLLKSVLEQASADDILGTPVPFLPSSPESYDIALVPKIIHKPPKAEKKMPMLVSVSTTKSVVVVEDITEKEQRKKSKKVRKPFSPVLKRRALPVVPTAQQHTEITMVELEPIQEDDIQDDVQVQYQDPRKDIVSLDWPVAPDGFLPNSVLRGMGRKQEECKPEKCNPKALLREFPEEEEDVPMQTSEISYILAMAKAMRCSKPPEVPIVTIVQEVPVEKEPELDEEDGEEEEEKEEKDHLLAIVECLRKIIQNLLTKLDQADSYSYTDFSESLFKVLQSQPIDSGLMTEIKSLLLEHVQNLKPTWKQLGGWRNLDTLELLHADDVTLLGKPLIDVDPELRQLARNILGRVFGIRTKSILRCRLQPIMATKELSQLLKRLTEDLDLQDYWRQIPQATKKQENQENQEKRKGKRKVTHTKELSAQPIKDQDYRWIPDPAPPIVESVGKESLLKEEPREMRRISVHMLKEKRKDSVLPPVRPTTTGQPSSRKKYKSFQIQARKGGVTEVERRGASVFDDLILYVYRKSHKHAVAKSCQLANPVRKRESLHVQPSDSGMGSLISHEVSSMQAPCGPIHYPDYCRIKRGEGDANWRENLHKLVSLYGFRSQRASKAAPPYSSFGPGFPAPFHTSGAKPATARGLPQLHSKHLWQSSLRERAVQRTLLKETWEKPPSQFQHELSLPWIPNNHSLCSHGQSRYGRLEVSGQDAAGPQTLSLPHITPNQWRR